MVPGVAGSSPVDRPLSLLPLVSMTLFEALLLGMIQGVTEFLPVSSSGHLILAQTLFGMREPDSYILFDLVCHMGTLVAILLLIGGELWRALCMRGNTLLQVFVGTLPLLPLVFVMAPIKAVYAHPEYLGLFFWFTSLLLVLSDVYGHEVVGERERSLFIPLVVGVGQAIAILPGVSRSGATIAVARLLGWGGERAVRFSLLLALPGIAGGTAYELLSLLGNGAEVAEISLLAYAIGFLSSLLIGYPALLFLLRVVKRGRLTLFAWYCLFLGAFSLLYFNG